MTPPSSLQWSRIPKDAEGGCGPGLPGLPGRGLQWSRIPKDAEGAAAEEAGRG